MTSMGMATDEVEQEWEELYTTIASGATTAVGAIEAMNAALEEAASKAEQNGKKVDSSTKRIKNTGATARGAEKKKAITKKAP
jgi:hypothetical protein